MNDKLRQIITIERTLSQLRQTLKFNFKMTLEEFILLYHVYENEKLSGKVLRDTLHFELMWDMSKIDVLIRKVYKKNWSQRCDLKPMNVKFIIILNQHKNYFLLKWLKKLSKTMTTF